jgi:PTS system mannose-specific IIC component
MIVEAILVGVMCYIASIGVPWFVGNTGGYYYLSRPLISGTIVGLILGDLKTGIIIGAALQAVYISHIIAAGGTSADITFVSYPATALAIISGASIEVAIGLAATIGVLGILIFNLMLTTNIFWIHAGDRALEKNSLKG